MNNAGFVLGVDKVGSILDADIDSMIATNVTGLICVTQLLVKGQNTDFVLGCVLDIDVSCGHPRF